MKQLILLLPVLFLLTACPSADAPDKDVLKSFKEHHYNLTDLGKRGYKKIHFKLPVSFVADYYSGYTLKTAAFTRREPTLGILFSVERFTEKDVEADFMKEEVIEKDILNSFQDAYVYRRYGSLENGGAAIKKSVKKNVRFPGVIQIVAGESTKGADILYYATSTLKVGKEYYLFQFITRREMMAYVYDDFERILASVRK